MANEIPDPAEARVFATLFQALIHGLAIQREANPEAYDPQRMAEACIHVLYAFLAVSPAEAPVTVSPKRAPRRKSKAGES
jgi:hypothetical protein